MAGKEFHASRRRPYAERMEGVFAAFVFAESKRPDKGGGPHPQKRRRK